MADSTLVLEVDAKTGKAERNVQDLREAIEEVGDSVEEMADAMDKGFEETGDAIESVSEKVDKVQADFSGFADLARGHIDELVPGLQDFQDGIADTSGGFKTLKGAIVSTGLGALVVILGQLVQWFMESEKGSKFLSQATEVLGAIMSNLMENVVEPLGTFLVNLFTAPQEAGEQFKGVIEGIWNWLTQLANLILGPIELGFLNFGKMIAKARLAWNEWFGDTADVDAALAELDRLNERIEEVEGNIKEAATAVAAPFVEMAAAVSEAVSSAIEDGNKLVELRDRVYQEGLKQEQLEARLNASAERHRSIVDDETQSYEKRKEALHAANAAERENLKNQAAYLKTQIALQQQEIAMASSLDDRQRAQEELAGLLAEQIENETELYALSVEYAEDLKDLDLDELDRKRDIAELIRDEKLAATKDTFEAQRELQREELKIAEEDALRELDELYATEEEKQALRDAFAAQRATMEEEFAKEDLERKKERAQTLRDLEDAIDAEDLEAELERRLAQLEREEAQHLEDMRLLGANEEELEGVRERYRKIRADAEKKSAEEIDERDKELLAKRVQNHVDFGNAIIDVVDTLNNRQDGLSKDAARRQFNINQALGVAQAIMSTAQGITNQLAVPQDALTGANFVKAGLVAASGAAQIAAIKAQKFDASAFDTPEAPSDAAADARPQQLGGIDLSFLQRDFEQEGGIRAYVVNQEIQNAGALAQTLEDRSRL